MMPSRNEEKVEFWINVVIEEGIDDYGRKYRRTQWQKCNHEIDLGSLKNPKNQNIVGFDWKEKSQINKMFDMFK